MKKIFYTLLILALPSVSDAQISSIQAIIDSVNIDIDSEIGIGACLCILTANGCSGDFARQLSTFKIKSGDTAGGERFDSWI